jgi:enoyl-CoA hydratase/carnithine racemase
MRSRADALELILAAASDAERSEALSPLGECPLVVAPVDDAPALAEAARDLRPGAPILVGVDALGLAPDGLGDLFDVLLTTAPAPPRPWVSVEVWGLDAAVSAIEGLVARRPVAASVFAEVLRQGERLDFDGALTLESLAYSTLLAGTDFRDWRPSVPVRARPPSDEPMVRLERRADTLIITLARPDMRNAVCARLRDELTEALRLVRADPSITEVELRGEGPSFCAGGDLDEFGQAGDLALAHIIRTQRSPARLVAKIGPRLTAYVQGAAIGGGIEIAAAAARMIADPATVFRLPEVGMGLIPGAGGTASLPRRIGRHRTCFMGLSGLDIGADQALAWGLVDRLEPVR